MSFDQALSGAASCLLRAYCQLSRLRRSGAFEHASVFVRDRIDTSGAPSGRYFPQHCNQPVCDTRSVCRWIVYRPNSHANDVLIAWLELEAVDVIVEERPLGRRALPNQHTLPRSDAGAGNELRCDLQYRKPLRRAERLPAAYEEGGSGHDSQTQQLSQSAHVREETLRSVIASRSVQRVRAQQRCIPGSVRGARRG